MPVRSAKALALPMMFWKLWQIALGSPVEPGGEQDNEWSVLIEIDGKILIQRGSGREEWGGEFLDDQGWRNKRYKFADEIGMVAGRDGAGDKTASSAA